MAAERFDALFTRDKPVIVAFHGYPWLIHRLTYRRTNTPGKASPRCAIAQTAPRRLSTIVLSSKDSKDDLHF